MGRKKAKLVVGIVSILVLIGILGIVPRMEAATTVEGIDRQPTWLGGPGRHVCVMNMTISNGSGDPTLTIKWINITLNNVTDFDAATSSATGADSAEDDGMDIAGAAANADSGVSLWNESGTTGGWQEDEDTLVSTTAPTINEITDNSVYRWDFPHPALGSNIGTREVYVVMNLTDPEAATGDKYNISISASQIVGDDNKDNRYKWPSADYYTDNTIEEDVDAPPAVTNIYVNNVTPSKWTNVESFFVNWTSGGADNGSGTKEYRYKVGGDPPVSWDEGYAAANEVNVTVSLSAPDEEDNITMYIWPVDHANNMGPIKEAYLLYDASPPADLQITLRSDTTDNETWTNDTAIEVIVDATEQVAGKETSGLYRLYAQNEGDDWMVLTTDPAEPGPWVFDWTLGTSADGDVKKVFYKADDYAGNEASPINDTILCDFKKPTIEPKPTLYPQGKTYATNESVDPNLAWVNVSTWVNDTASGVNEVHIDVSSINSTYATPQLMTLGSGDIYNGVYYFNVTIDNINATNDGLKNLSVNATDLLWSNTPHDPDHINDTGVISIMTDASPPDVTPEATIYPSFSIETTESVTQTWACSGQTVTLNVTITDCGALKTVQVNATPINSDLGWLDLTNVGDDLYQVDATVNISSGVYNNLTVNATDELGNKNDTENLTVQVDNDIPNVMNPDVVYVSHPNVVDVAWNGDTITLNATVVDVGNADILYNSTGGYKYVLLNATLINQTAGWVVMKNTAGNNYKCDVEVSGAANGTHLLQIKAYDNASNCNDTEVIEVNVDDPPLAHPQTTIYPVNQTAATYDNEITIWVKINDSGDMDNVTVNVSKVNSTDVWIELTKNYTSGVWTHWNTTIVVDTGADGAHLLQVNATDWSGNQNLTENITVIVDTKIPAVTVNPVTYPAGQTQAKEGDTVTLNVTVTDATSGVYDVEVNVTNITGTSNDWRSMGRVSGTDYYTLDVVIGINTTGTMSCPVSGYDNASNCNATEVISVDVDNVIPEVSNPWVKYWRHEPAWNSENITVNVTVKDVDSGIAYVTIDGGNITVGSSAWYTMYDDGTHGDKVSGDGNYTLNITIGDRIVEDEYWLLINGTDNARNLNLTAKINVTVFNPLPKIPATDVTYYDDPAKVAAKPGSNVTLNVTVDSYSAVNHTDVSESGVWINVTNITGIVDDWRLMENTTPQGSGVTYWELNVTVGDVANDIYTLPINVTTVVGKSNKTATIEVKVDTKDPELSRNPTTYESGGGAANYSEWVILNVTSTDWPAGIYNVSVNVEEINNTYANPWLEMSIVSGTDYYTVQVEVNESTAPAQGYHYLPARAQDNVSHWTWLNGTDGVIVYIDIGAPAIDVYIEAQTSGGNATIPMAIIGDWVNITAKTDTDVGDKDATIDLSDFTNATGVSLNSTEIMIYIGTVSNKHVYYYNFTLYLNRTSAVNNETNYIFTVTATDLAGKTAFASNNTTGIDICSPRSAVAQISADAYWNATEFNEYNGINVSWAPKDPSGLDSDVVSYDVYRKVGDGDWVQWLDDSTSTYAYYQDVAGLEGYTFYFYSAANDWAGNAEVENVTAEGDANTTLDTVAPSFILYQINAVGNLSSDPTTYTHEAIVNLTVQASDATSGVNHVFFSNNGTAWYNAGVYNGTWLYYHWDLTDTAYGGENIDGWKTVYFRVNDVARNNNTLSAADCPTILLDRFKPINLSIVINGGATSTNSSTVTLNLSAEEDTSNTTDVSGLWEMRFYDVLYDEWTDWMPYNTTYNLTLRAGDGEREIKFQCRDKAWNNATPVSDSILLNEGLPTIEYGILIGTVGGYDADGKPWYTSNVTAYINATDKQKIDSLSYKVHYENGTWYPASGWNTTNYTGVNYINVSISINGLEGIFEIYYYAVNNASTANTSYKDSPRYIRIDKTPPDTNLTTTPDWNVNEWYNTNVTVWLNSADNTTNVTTPENVSGVNWTTYHIYNETTGEWGYYNATYVWTTGWARYDPSTGILFPYEGNYTVECNATDYANLSNSPVNFTGHKIRIDKHTPEITTFTITGSHDSTPTTVGTNTTNVTLDIEAQDTGAVENSSMWQMCFSNDSVTWTSWEDYAANGSYPWTLTSGDGLKHVYYRVRDRAGNEMIEEENITLDTTPPTSSIGALPDYIAVEDFNVTWNGSDAGVGLKAAPYTILYKRNNGTGWPDNWTIWLPEHRGGTKDLWHGVNGTWYRFRCIAVDQVDNVEVKTTYDEQILVDLTAPTSSVEAISPYWYNGAIPITAIGKDPSPGIPSGIAFYTLYYRYSDDNSTWGDWALVGNSTTGSWSWAPPDDGYYQFYCTATDKAGNNESYSPTVEAKAGYDTAPPSLSATLSGTAGENNWYVTIVTINLTASDPSPASGVSGIEYHVDETPWKNYTRNFTIKSEGIHMVYYRATDVAGNVVTNSREVKIDLYAPVASAPSDEGEYSTSASLTWTWSAGSDTCSGVVGYYISIGTTSNANESVKDRWIGNVLGYTWAGAEYVTYYAKIKAKDEAGNVGNYSTSSDGIKIDMTPPSAPTPKDEGVWSNNKKLTWTWNAASDGPQGSGVAGYYVWVSTTVGEPLPGYPKWKTKPTFTTSENIEDGNTYYAWIVARDNAGNNGTTSSSDGITVDLTPPTSAVLGLPTYQTTLTFLVYWEGTDTLPGELATYTIQYKEGGGTWHDWVTDTGSASKQFTGVEGKTYYFRSIAKDKAGNVETAYSDAGDTNTTIDTEQPTTWDDAPGGWQRVDSITITLHEEDATSEVNKTYYKLWRVEKPEPTSYSEGMLITISGDGKWKIKYYSVDNAGNEQDPIVKPVWLDNTPPTTKDDAPAGWQTTSPVRVHLDPNDETSDVKTTYYKLWRVGETEPVGYTEDTLIIITEDGKWNIKYYSVDVAGNVETEMVTPKQVWLDETSPTTTDNAPRGWQRVDSINITLDEQDAPSGVKITYYKKWRVEEQEPTSYSVGTTITISGDGKWKIKYYSVDNASNEQDPMVKPVWLDNTPPITKDDAPAGWQTTDSVTVHLVANDATSDVETAYYKKWRVGETEPTKYVEGTFMTIREDGKWNIKYYSVDVAGNAESPKSTEVWLDKTPPTAMAEVSKREVYVDKALRFTGNASSDETSGVVSYYWQFGDGATSTERYPEHSYTDSGTYTVRLTVTDEAGNVDSETIKIKVKKKKPVPPIPGFEVLALVAAIGAVLLLLKRRKH